MSPHLKGKAFWIMESKKNEKSKNKKVKIDKYIRILVVCLDKV